MRSLHHVPDPAQRVPGARAGRARARVDRRAARPRATFFELLRPVDDETEVRAAAQRGDRRAQGFARVETIEYDIRSRSIVRGAPRRGCSPPTPTRAARFTEAEPQLRALFTPGDYVERVRADLLPTYQPGSQLAGRAQARGASIVPVGELGGDRLCAREQPVDDPPVAVAGEPGLADVRRAPGRRAA